MSVHHAKSMKGVSFRAVCGCFRPNQLLLAWLKPSDDASGTENNNVAGEWLLTTIELSVLLQFMITRDAAHTTPSGTKYLIPIDLGTVHVGGAESSRGENVVSSLVCKSVIHTQRTVNDFYNTYSEHNATCLGTLYAIGERVFLCTADGAFYLFNASSDRFYGTVTLPHTVLHNNTTLSHGKSIDKLEPNNNGQHEHVVSAYLDLYTDSTNPSVNILTSEGQLLKVSLKGLSSCCEEVSACG